jgi:hypothetical protein
MKYLRVNSEDRGTESALRGVEWVHATTDATIFTLPDAKSVQLKLIDEMKLETEIELCAHIASPDALSWVLCASRAKSAESSS